MAAIGEQIEWTPSLLRLEEDLLKIVSCSPANVGAICKTIRKKAAGLRLPLTPLGRFLMVSESSSVVELASALAACLFGDLEKRTLRLDMRDYSELHQARLLVGLNGGLICQWIEGEFTEPIRLQPRVVVTLENIEAAHPRVWELLLPGFAGEGLVDTLQRPIDLSQAIFFFTTNVGCLPQAEQNGDTSNTESSPRRNSNHVRYALECRFPAEMIRGTFIDDILVMS